MLLAAVSVPRSCCRFVPFSPHSPPPPPRNAPPPCAPARERIVSSENRQEIQRFQRPRARIDRSRCERGEREGGGEGHGRRASTATGNKRVDTHYVINNNHRAYIVMRDNERLCATFNDRRSMTMIGETLWISRVIGYFRSFKVMENDRAVRVTRADPN